MVKQRLRRGEPSPPGDAYVLRGGDLDPDVLAVNAAANHAVYGYYGISVWVATDVDDIDRLAATKLRGAGELTVMTVADVVAAGLEIWDTGQAPHYDLVYDDGADVEALVNRVVGVKHTSIENVHYEPEGDAR